jgi:serine phosphatase RsbU (regulator of sigma subunit)
MKTIHHKIGTLTGVESWSRPAGLRSGDFVLRREMPHMLTTVVADVAGHGEEAAQVAAYIRPIISREVEGLISIKMLRRWHKQVYRRFQVDNRFVCITLLQLNLDTQMLTIINAGNPDVLVHRGSSTSLERFMSTGMPLGLVASSEWIPPTIESTCLRSSDYVICFTDGVVDCLDAAGNRFGLGRVYSAVQTASARSPLRAVRRGLLRFWSPQADQDDLSILVMRGRHRVVA